MRYDFTSREREMGRIVFALTLDRKKQTERIVIGRVDEVRRRLESSEGEVYYDEVRPLGSLLIDFEADADRAWNVNSMKLHESYSKTFPFEAERWKLAAPVGDYLRKKYDRGEPSAMFASIKTWDEYLNCYNMKHGADLLIQRLTALYRPFIIYAEERPWQTEAANALSSALRSEDSAVELWYPVAKCPFECVVTGSSLLPIVAYYLHKVEEWHSAFQQCKVCGKYFCARSKHYELCSKKCRTAQQREGKRQYDERTKGDRVEEAYDNAYHYFYNRLRKLKRGYAPDEHIAVIKEAFRIFRTEAKRKKSKVKSGELPFSDFTTWLAQEQVAVDALMDDLE